MKPGAPALLMVERATAPVVAALRKAEEHAAAADAIAIQGNYPMAFSHVVLGLEEMAVSKLHKGALLGLFKLGGPSDDTDLFQLDWSELYVHKTKLLAIVLYAATWRVERARTEVLLEATKRGERPTEGDLVRRQEAEFEVSKLLLGDLPRLEPLKEGGLYSADLDHRGRPAVRATLADYDRWRPVLADCLDAEQFFLAHPDEEVDDVMLKIAQDAKAAIVASVRQAMAEQKARQGPTNL